MSYNEEYELAELTFNVTNLVENPIFAYYDSTDNDPNDWYAIGNAEVNTGHVTYGEVVHPNYGYQYMNLDSGEIRQILSVDASESYYLRVDSFPITGDTLTVGMNFYSSVGELITGETTAITAGGWSSRVTFTAPATASLGLLRVFTDHNIGIEAVQLDVTDDASFSRMPRPQDMTIEWEGSDKGIYEIDDLTLNPITNPQTNGFLCIPNLPASQFDKEASSDARTLLDWGWQNGRLTYLPWAKTEGKNKWNNITHEVPYGLPESVGYTAPLQQPSSILVSPDVLNIVQGATGDDLYFQAFDVGGNVIAHHDYTAYLWDETGEFPGYLATREFGFYTRVGQQIVGETNSAGGSPVHIVPVDIGHVQMTNPRPNASFGATGEAVYFFNTKYEVSPTNHGNPTLTGPDGVQVTLTGDVVSEFRPCYPRGDLYDSALTSYPWMGTVKALDDNDLRLLEVFHATPGLGEFSVDYENRVITTKSPGPISLTYTPRVLWKDPRYKRRIFMKTGTSLPTQYRLNHDAQVWFAVKVSNEWVSKWLRTRVNYLNPEALEER